jgi:hypothetical protein
VWSQSPALYYQKRKKAASLLSSPTQAAGVSCPISGTIRFISTVSHFYSFENWISFHICLHSLREHLPAIIYHTIKWRSILSVHLLIWFWVMFVLFLNILASNNSITNVWLGPLTTNWKEILTTGCGRVMKRLDCFSSYYVSIGRTGFNLKRLPVLAKVTSSVSHMKLGKIWCWDKLEISKSQRSKRAQDCYPEALGVQPCRQDLPWVSE